MLRKALQDAVERGYLGRNVCDQANPPTQRDARGRRARDRSWTLDQVRMFLDKTAEDRLAPVWVLLATTGLRRAEVLGLRWSEVDLERGRLRISQTITEVRGRLIIQGDGKSDAAERSIGLDTRTIETLRRWKVTQAADQLSWPGDWPTHGLVFTQSNGQGYRPKRLSSQFTTASDAAGLPRIGAHGRPRYVPGSHPRWSANASDTPPSWSPS